MSRKDEQKWTKEQLSAIETRGKNMLVSAGAGSGKTAVMIERVTKLITDGDASVSDLLIVTFTDAAATEMRDRLRSAIKEEFRDRVKDGEDASWLREEAELISSSDISTFHAFSRRVIDNFFYLTDIEPGYRVLDASEAEVMKEEAISELFRTEYENSDDAFISLLDHYSGERDDGDVRWMVRELWRKVNALPGKFALPEEKVEELAFDLEKFRTTNAYKYLGKIVEEALRSALPYSDQVTDELKSMGLPVLAEKQHKDSEMIADAISLLSEKGVEACLESLAELKFINLRASGDEVEGYQYVKDDIAAKRSAYKGPVQDIAAKYGAPLDDILGLSRLTYDAAVELIELAKKFDDIYSADKRDRKVIDYDDMEHYCLAILEDESAAEYYRDRFKYIFVDEYQDTNIMQETIIAKIRRKDNLFMVGDIKQSIYHFRLADPEIFQGRYDEYKKLEASGDSSSVAINLNSNFRSRRQVIDTVNDIFRPMMRGYDKNAELVCGTPDEGELLPGPETFVIDKSDSDEIPEELEELANEELEASFITGLIDDMVGKKKFFDRKKGEVRTVKYSDIVILMRSFRGSAEGYLEVFRNADIPLYVDDNEGYFDTIEINVFLALLSVIDNRFQDVPFISLIHSEIFGFSSEELARVRKYVPDGDYVSAALYISENSDIDEELSVKLADVFRKIGIWKAYAVTLPLPDLIWRLLTETGYYMTAGALPGGAQRQANLRLLVERARQYSSYSQDSLYGFIRYIEQVKQDDIKLAQATMVSENDDVVRLMTIHHSKGLEYPVVIMSGMGRTPNGGNGGSVMFDRSIGLGMRAVFPDLHAYQNNLQFDLICDKESTEELEESMRVFYVGATRARETFYMVGVVRDFGKWEAGYEAGTNSPASFLGMARYLPDIKRVPSASLVTPVTGNQEEKGRAPSGASAEDMAFVDRMLSFEYPYERAGKLRAKTTVTGLNRMTESAGSFEETRPGTVIRTPDFLKGEETLSYAEIGTSYHTVMEHIDMTSERVTEDAFARETAERLVSMGIMQERELEAIDFSKISGFFRSELGKRAVSAARAGDLYREKTFELKVDVDGEDIYVQGIIDLYFKENDGLVLIDYKTNYIDPKKDMESELERLKKTYGKQIELYREALEISSGAKVKESYLYLFGIGDTISYSD